MSTDPQAPRTDDAPPAAPAKQAPSGGDTATRPRGIRIFSYPKVVFLIPSLVVALICGTGMLIIGNRTEDPRRAVVTTPPAPGAETTAGTQGKRFGTPQNILGVIFLGVFALNLLTMSLDFPRFTVIALIFFFAALGFFLLWLNSFYELLEPLAQALEHVYVVANAAFYFCFALVISINLVIVYLTRYLDYWEVLPNEILHNHGPFSDLERFPTINLKFDKEIPDILEYALLRSGRLVLHVPGQSKSIVLDNVLWINRKEEELKKILSRMEVRLTTDRETAGPL